MKLIAQLKLLPTPEQAASLRSTMERTNAACSAISRVAWEQRQFGKYTLHHLVYASIRERFGLSAQIVVRAIAKVADSYALDKRSQRTFQPLGSIAYDDRILTYRTDKQFVTIWTVGGRLKIPFVCGERQRRLLQSRQGESDLVYRNGMFFLLATCNVDEPTPDQVDGALGVDLGIVHLATDSDGESYSGAVIDRTRERQERRRQALQSVGTPSAKRRLKRNSGRQRRFQSNTNHTIAKRLVQKAKDSARGIALENLTHIRARITVRKSERSRHSNWSFAQLRAYISYKAALAGVTVQTVNPAYSSRTCSMCGYCDKRNRRSQASFHCISCSFTADADHNAACNIRDWAAVDQPMVAGSYHVPTASATSPVPLWAG